MLSVLIGAVCNIILDPIFIYGMDMGVKGAALATILSQAMSTLWVLRFLTGKKTTLRIRRKNMRLQGRILKPIFTLGLSAFIMQASESIILVCFNSSLLKYGGDVAVGAMTILSSIMQFSNLPAQGLARVHSPSPATTTERATRTVCARPLKFCFAVRWVIPWLPGRWLWPSHRCLPRFLCHNLSSLTLQAGRYGSTVLVWVSLVRRLPAR